MTFSRTPSRRAARTGSPWRLALAGAAVLLGLAACGGGDPVNEFEPQRILVFGDESSLLTAEGKNYSINGLDPAPPEPPASEPAVDNPPPGPIDCRARRIWVQVLADDFGFGFPQCSSDPAAPQRGTIYATAGARVADLATQVAAHEAVSSFTPRDLVTVLVGQHDVLDIYAGLAGSGAQCAAAAAQDGPARGRGRALAAQINRIARDGDGGRVLFITVVRQGDTPFGRQTTPDPGRRDCLNALTDAFNAGLRTDVTGDGRHMALVAIDEQARLIVEDPDRFRDFEDVRNAACTVDTPECTTATLVPAAAGGDDFLWADELHFGPEFHDLLGDLASDRVRNDVPF